MPNQNELRAMLDALSKKMGTTPQELEQSAQSGQLDRMLLNLNPNEAQKLQSVLQIPEAANALLNSTQAQQLIKKLTGG